MARRPRKPAADGGFYIIVEDGYVGPFKTDDAANDAADKIEDDGGKVLEVTDARNRPPTKRESVISDPPGTGDIENDPAVDDYDSSDDVSGGDFDSWISGLGGSDDDSSDDDSSDDDQLGDDETDGDDQPDKDTAPAITHKWFKPFGT